MRGRFLAAFAFGLVAQPAYAQAVASVGPGPVESWALGIVATLCAAGVIGMIRLAGLVSRLAAQVEGLEKRTSTLEGDHRDARQASTEALRRVHDRLDDATSARR